MFEKSFKILNFGSNGMQLKFTVSVHIGAQFTVGKPKILLKPKISAKTASLGIINNVSPRSQKNQKILVKLSQKTFSGPKLGLYYHYGSIILTQPIIGPSIYTFWMSSFSFWVFVILDFSQKNYVFMVQGLFGLIWGILWAITPVNNS